MPPFLTEFAPPVRGQPPTSVEIYGDDFQEGFAELAFNWNTNNNFIDRGSLNVPYRHIPEYEITLGNRTLQVVGELELEIREATFHFYVTSHPESIGLNQIIGIAGIRVIEHLSVLHGFSV